MRRPRAQGARRLRRAALRRDRRRDELGEVPHRRARRGRRDRAPSSTAPRSPASARASTTPAGWARSRSGARSTRSPRWPTRRAATAPRRSRPSGRRGCGSRANAADLLDAVETRSGIRIEVIPGEDEARLAYLAAKAGLGPRFAAGAVVVFDTGGGSSQFTFGRGGQVDERFSVNVGAVAVHRALRPRRRRLRRLLAEALAAIAAGLERAGRPPAAGRGGRDGRRGDEPRRGAPRPRDVRPRGRPGHRARPRRDRPPDRAATATAPPSERRAIVGLQPNRAEVILAGACIVRTVLAKLGRDALTVSDRGLRHGVALERFGVVVRAARRRRRRGRQRDRRQPRGHREAQHRRQPADVAALPDRLGDHRVDEHHEQRAGGEPVDRGVEVGRDVVGDREADDGRQGADQRDEDPEAADRRGPRARGVHRAGRPDRLRQVRDEDRDEQADADPLAGREPDAEDGLLRDAVEEGAEREGGARAAARRPPREALRRPTTRSRAK